MKRIGEASRIVAVVAYSVKFFIGPLVTLLTLQRLLCAHTVGVARSVDRAGGGRS